MRKLKLKLLPPKYTSISVAKKGRIDNSQWARDKFKFAKMTGRMKWKVREITIATSEWIKYCTKQIQYLQKSEFNILTLTHSCQGAKSKRMIPFWMEKVFINILCFFNRFEKFNKCRHTKKNDDTDYESINRY